MKFSSMEPTLSGAMDCESLDAWAELLEMLSAVKALLCTPEGSPHDNKAGERKITFVMGFSYGNVFCYALVMSLRLLFLAETLVRVESLLDCVHAAQLLSSRGVPVTCKAVMDASQSNSNAVVIQLLQGANRSLSRSLDLAYCYQVHIPPSPSPGPVGHGQTVSGTRCGVTSSLSVLEACPCLTRPNCSPPL